MHDYSKWLKTPASPRVELQETHVWRAPLDVQEDILRRATKSLSYDENLRAEKLRSVRDRDRFIIAHAILRNLVAKILGCPLAKIVIERGPRGKPHLEGRHGESRLQFNVSHSQAWALYALARVREVGIDIEEIRPESATQEIVERYFSAGEQREFLSLPEELRPEAFFSCWTRKEAYVKARGDGLQIPLDSFSVSLNPGKPPILASDDAGRWDICSFYPAPGFVGSLVSEKNMGQLRFWDLHPDEFV